MAENNNDLSTLVQRFAISALSRERKAEAINEEIIVSKHTGEFYIKTRDGIIMSTDILNRNNASTNNAIKAAEISGMTGDLFKVEFDNLQLPNFIDYNNNVLYSEPITIPTESKEILFNIDLDEFDVVDNDIKNVYSSGGINIKISLYNNNNTIVKTIDLSATLQDINFTIFSLKDLFEDNNFNENSIIKIHDLSISIDPNIFNLNAIDRAVLLHNIFITVNY